eukprot:COSAG06_NODE_17284_length_950_cov_2.117509_2_plen_87_part_01
MLVVDQLLGPRLVRTDIHSIFFRVLLSLCLSRACRGKMIVVIHIWLKNAVLCAIFDDSNTSIFLPSQARDRQKQGRFSTLNRLAFYA